MKENKRLMLGRLLQKMARGDQDGLEAKASLGTGEDNSGANLTQPELLGELLRPSWAEGTLYERCNIYDVSDKANGAYMPVVAESVRTVAGGVLGGFIAYPVVEGAAVTPSKSTFARSTLDLNQVGVLSYVTNALIQDSSVLERYLSKGTEECLRYYLDYYILYGTGTTMNGLTVAAGDRATGTVTMTSPFAEVDYKTIVGKYYGGSNGCWAMGRDAWARTCALYSSTFPLRFDDNGKAFLFGYPVIVKNCMEAHGIMLGDFSQYFLCQKAIKNELSTHLAFVTNQSVFRAIIRVNGMPQWIGGVATEDGTTIYPFVEGVQA